MSNRHLDDQIDRTVREMMNVDASGAFGRRVFGRIDARPSRRLEWMRVALTATAAVILTLAVVRMRTPSTPLPLPRPDGVQQTATRPAVERAPSTSSSTEVAAAPSTQPAVPPRRAVPRRTRPRTTDANVTFELPAGMIVATVAGEEPVSVEPIALVEPVAADAPASRPIAPAPIVVAPLAPISEVRIAPLFPPIERD